MGRMRNEDWDMLGTFNVQHSTFNVQRSTFNIQHRTQNIEHRNLYKTRLFLIVFLFRDSSRRLPHSARRAPACLGCGGKRRATPLSQVQAAIGIYQPLRDPKAPSPLRSAGAVQKRSRQTATQPHGHQMGLCRGARRFRRPFWGSKSAKKGWQESGGWMNMAACHWRKTTRSLWLRWKKSSANGLT